ncbi:MAG: hypothetical protein ACI97B_002852, partial [Verrucomicrobiales bacterium]
HGFFPRQHNRWIAFPYGQTRMQGNGDIMNGFHTTILHVSTGLEQRLLRFHEANFTLHGIDRLGLVRDKTRIIVRGDQW